MGNEIEITFKSRKLGNKKAVAVYYYNPNTGERSWNYLRNLPVRRSKISVKEYFDQHNTLATKFKSKKEIEKITKAYGRKRLPSYLIREPKPVNVYHFPNAEKTSEYTVKNLSQVPDAAFSYHYSVSGNVNGVYIVRNGYRVGSQLSMSKKIVTKEMSIERAIDQFWRAVAYNVFGNSDMDDIELEDLKKKVKDYKERWIYYVRRGKSKKV
jgi:hypothetical protein